MHLLENTLKFECICKIKSILVMLTHIDGYVNVQITVSYDKYAGIANN